MDLRSQQISNLNPRPSCIRESPHSSQSHPERIAVGDHGECSSYLKDSNSAGKEISHTEPEVAFEREVKVNRVVCQEEEKKIYSPSSPTCSKRVWMTVIIFLVET